nr:hypothetical protein [Tanacetum cinerariifolium]
RCGVSNRLANRLGRQALGLDVRIGQPEQLDGAVPMFDQRGAGLDPVAAVEASAVGGDMLRLVDQLDVAQNQLGITTQEFVVVTGDVDHFGAALAHGQQAADDVGVRLRPVHPATQFPAVDDIAD